MLGYVLILWIESSVKNDAMVLPQPVLLTGGNFVKRSLTVGPCLDPTPSGIRCARDSTLGPFWHVRAAWQQKSSVVISTRCYTWGNSILHICFFRIETSWNFIIITEVFCLCCSKQCCYCCWDDMKIPVSLQPYPLYLLQYMPLSFCLLLICHTGLHVGEECAILLRVLRLSKMPSYCNISIWGKAKDLTLLLLIWFCRQALESAFGKSFSLRCEKVHIWEHEVSGSDLICQLENDPLCYFQDFSVK